MYKRKLYHYNKNHDPRNGQFTSGSGMPGGTYGNIYRANQPTRREARRAERQERREYKDAMNRALKPGAKGKPSNAEKIARQTSEGTDAAIRIARRTRKQPQVDLSNMTDQELNDAINRLVKEQRYLELTGQNVTTGQQRLEDTLHVVGDVAAVGSSALAIASAIYMIKGGAG